MIVGISGASGAIYGIRMLEMLKEAGGVETHLVMSRYGKLTLELETSWKASDVEALADVVHNVGDQAASIASGSFRADGMVIAPCSMDTLAAIASSASSNLLTRAAAVTLKERRRLVLMPRESPLHLGHCRQLVAVTEMGAIVAPPMPSFYARPATIDDIVDHSVGRALDLFGIDVGNLRRWEGPDR